MKHLKHLGYGLLGYCCSLLILRGEYLIVILIILAVVLLRIGYVFEFNDLIKTVTKRTIRLFNDRTNSRSE